MGRVKYTVHRKKRTANSPSNQPAPHTEEPSTNPKPVNTVPLEIQTKAQPRDDLCQRSNDMPSNDAFDLYSQPKTTAPASRKKGSKRHPGESSSDPSKKRVMTKDPPTPIPSKETTHPPAPVDQTPPPASVDPTPPDQQEKLRPRLF
ncbi:uncharacterized protein LOC133796049 [Humulus lupulus]|uniref:uncharacterized protein LOC133796049 n=1 Tax=Humulus lupulus TaxID=3486 RepID=UPI002B414CB8|nr:uncharacterized protein LOC133796049 [Humulus lupulus]